MRAIGPLSGTATRHLDAAGVPTWVEAGGRADATNPVKALVGWDSLTSAAPRVPALNMSSEHGIGGAPFRSQPDPAAKKGAFRAYQAAGVPVVTVTPRGSTHFELSLIPTFPTTSWAHGNPVVERLSLAWLDRWLKVEGEPGFDDADARLLADDEPVYPVLGSPGRAETLRDRLSIYFSAARDFPTRGGEQAVCEDILDGCPALGEGGPGPVVPEAPCAPALPVAAVPVAGVALRRRRR